MKSVAVFINQDAAFRCASTYHEPTRVGYVHSRGQLIGYNIWLCKSKRYVME